MSFDITDARGRTMVQLDPMNLHLLPRHSELENQSIEQIIEEITQGSSKCRRLTWVVLGIGTAALIALAASPVIEGRDTWQRLETLVTEPAFIAPSLLWLMWIPTALAQRRRAQRRRGRRVMAILLTHRRCPHCGNSLSGLPVDPTDGATVCPACAGAWRLDDAAISTHCAATCCAFAPQSACRTRRLLLVALGLAALAVALAVTIFLKT